MKHDIYPLTKRGFSHIRIQTGGFLFVLLTVLTPQVSHAVKGYPMPECAEKLFSCAKDAAQTVGQSVLTVGNILGHVVANADCVAAMASGSPPAIGVTGLVVGLGAAGIVQPTSCEAGVYGPAIVPVGAALDAVLGSNLSSKLAGATLEVAMDLIKPIPVPAVPPTVGQLISCGCGALEAGAQALEDVRKVAKFAAQTYESCGAAVNSCPGLKEVVAVLKGAYQVITDPSSIVQSCDSMSRGQYVDARLRDLIIPVRDQFRNNIAWSGSDMEVNHWIPRLNTCNNYYDSHCYKEGDAKSFCAQAVYNETFDPLVWAAIIDEFNGPQFDKFFAENRQKLAPPIACPKDPGGINIDPNAVSATEQGKAAQSANAKACTAEMQDLINGEKDSMKSLAREMLPTTREGWDTDVRQKYTEKPLDNARKVFLRVMTAASVVTKSKMTLVSAKYAAQDANVAKNSEFAAVPYIVLNKKYGEWANIIAKTIQDSCPKDPTGWNGKYDLTCVKELATSVGMSANEASTLKLDGQIVGAIAQSLSSGTFKGSKYYNIASNIVLNGTPGAPPSIRIQPITTENELARYAARWPAAEAAASLAYAADMPGFFGKQFERVTQEKAKRRAQDDVFAALEKSNKIEGDYAATVCDKLKTGQVQSAMPMLCRSDISSIAATEVSRFAVSKARVFLNINNSEKPGPDAEMAKAVTEIRATHDTTAKAFLAVHKKFSVDPERVLLAGMTRTGSSSGSAVKASLSPGAVAGGVAAVAAAAPKSDAAGAPVKPGQIAVVPSGPNSGLLPGAAGSMAPIVKDQKVGLGPVGMPGLPQMIRVLPPAVNKIPPAFDPGVNNTGKTGGAAVIANNAPVPAPSAGALAALKEDTLKPGGSLAAQTLPPAAAAAAGSIVAMTSPVTAGAATTGSTPATLPANIAATLLPFDPIAYRKERDKSLADEWFPKCLSQPRCLQTMSGIAAKRIDAEVMQLKSGPPDFRNKAAVLAFQDSLDGLYDPQFKAAIPAMVTATPPPVNVVPQNSLKNPNLIKKVP